jgi:predicted O-methyltransferase YrrM
MFTDHTEQEFFISHLKSPHRVLEYGSGYSTIEIAQKVKEIVSIEHQQTWYDTLVSQIPKNCDLILCTPSLPYTEGGHDGTYEEFKDYIESPLNKGIFDIILIDGRARVSCASVCKSMSHPDTLIFIHDFQRSEYQEALNYLELIDMVGNMAKFKIKNI